MSRGHPGYPSRPLLRPGVRVCRRADGVLQVALNASLRVVAPDSPEIRAVLDGLRHGVAPPEPADCTAATVRLCADLLERRLVLDADALLAAIGDRDDPATREHLTALFADAGPAAADLHARRTTTAVAVCGDGAPAALARCRHLLGLAGLGLAGMGPAGLGRTGMGPGEGLVVLVSRGEPDRVMVDDWLRDDRPHVIVSTAEGVVQLGPFVVPGLTACLRCIDAHHTELDPRRSLIVQQYAEPTAAAPVLPEPVPHDLLELAVAFVVRDVVNWAEGRRPRLWSATLRVDPSLDLAVTPWPRHPGCGCAWPQAAAG